jgi:pimeloyl-ACP methyl ester carboxylesterase
VAADLVEALWRARSAEATVVVAFDYSCIVSLELLARRIDRQRAGEDPETVIRACVLANGGPATAGFVDGHREHAARWDFARIVAELGGAVRFGSSEDRFEARQLAPKRSRPRSFPGPPRDGGAFTGSGRVSGIVALVSRLGASGGRRTATP